MAGLRPTHRDEIRALVREIHDTVAGFVRGQIVICLILAVLYAAALKLTGLNHAILIGLTAGLISFVPYLGAGTGFLVAVCVAMAQFWPNWMPVAVVAGIFLVGEMLADYVLSPRIIGRRVKLNPVWMMFALFAFGWLFGFIGLLVGDTDRGIAGRDPALRDPPGTDGGMKHVSVRASFTEVFASLSVSPSFAITIRVHASASAARPRLRMTKSREVRERAAEAVELPDHQHMVFRPARLANEPP